MGEVNKIKSMVKRISSTYPEGYRKEDNSI